MPDKRIKDLAVHATEFASDDYIVLDGTTNGTRNMTAANLLELTAENSLAGNLAPEFDPNKLDDTTGYAYHRNEIVAFGGSIYKFILNKPSGGWDSSYVKKIPLSDNVQQIF